MTVKISAIQQFSDSGFGGFVVLIASPLDKILFSPAPFCFFSSFLSPCLLSLSTSHHHPPQRFCYVWVFLSFLPRWARPEALIAKLVYIGEINALQMRLNTYSKNADSAYRDYRPSHEAQKRAAARSLSHPLSGRGFSISLPVSNSWNYITPWQE